MKYNLCLTNHFMKWKLFCTILPLLAVAGVATATDSVGPTDPNAYYSFTCPPDPLPNIDATNFVINNTFTISFQALSTDTLFYEPWNTLNYTNNGTMEDNTGFRFDTQTHSSQHSMAGTFYNAGTVVGGSLFSFAANYAAVLFNGYGQIVVSATNIYNTGVLDVGTGGFIKMTGQNINLNSGTLTVESAYGTNFQFTIPAINSTGAVGLDTNADWDPKFALSNTSAYSGYVYISAVNPYATLNLSNSTAYLDVFQTDVSNRIIRAVFVQNASTNIPYRVYFNYTNQFGGTTYDLDFATVEWDGTYLDPATGTLLTNYLYLFNDYFLGASTNAAVYSGVPNNFNFEAAQIPQITNGVPSGKGFVGSFPNAIYTNRYSFMNAQLFGGTQATNASPSNPSGSVTNLTGRIQISASNTLSMAQAVISGPNYMSVICTNQFNGSAGASIATPYSDVSLGVTNGFLTVSNLLMAAIPQWNGTVITWTTRWLDVDASGVTNDYRVELVYDNLTPTTPPWIKNLQLHATNSLVVSDALNVYGTMFADAQNLTLGTNVVGNGATSPDGELNFYSGATLSTAQLPNLVWLTNNGAIRSLNNINLTNLYTSFVYVATNYTYFTNDITLLVTTNYAVSTNTLPRNWLAAFINNSLVTNQAMSVLAVNFTNNGVINSGAGTFGLKSSSGNFVNGATLAASDVNISATNLLIAGEYINAGRALNLQTVQTLSDGATNLVANGQTNGNIWVVGANGIGGTDSGFNALVNPLSGDLLGTTVTNIAPVAKTIYNVWSGVNRGINTSGYSNNLAVGHLVLDSLYNTATPGRSAGIFNFAGSAGAGVTNTLYVDCLELSDYATNVDSGYNPKTLQFATNFIIYYAQAFINGQSVAEKINHKGIDVNGVNNSDHLRWVPGYAGYFSYTNLVYPDGTTNAVNQALAQSTDISSGGNLSSNNKGIPTQIFIPSQINLNVTITNNLARRLTWTIPATATNYFVQYKTNLLTPGWTLLPNSTVTNAPGRIPLATTNVFFLDTNSGPMRFYQVVEQPWLTYPQ